MANSKTEIKTYFGQCKCCLNYAYLKNMWEQHSTVEDSENREIYGKMLVDCFSISWTIHENIEDDKICEVCISRLKDAFSFKKQLLLSQDELMKDSKAKTDDGYKNEDSSDDEPKNYENVEFLEEEILEGLNSQVESQDLDQSQLNAKEGKSSKDSGKKHRQNRMYTEDQLVEAVEKVQSNEMTLAAASATYKIPRKSIETKMMNGLGNESLDRKKMNKFIKEIQGILTHTNATPFRSRRSTYSCFYCPLDSPTLDDPEELRTHTHTKHKDKVVQVEFMMRPHYYNEILRLDVEDLTCNTCNVKGTWLEMIEHLESEHEIDLEESKKRIAPYRLTSHEMPCALCELYACFSIIDAHINSHFTNYICGECGDTFLTLARLKYHSKIHQIGVFPCNMCDKMYSRALYRKKHIDLVHNKKLMHRCVHCDERFASETLRYKHMEQNHKEKLKVRARTCRVCNKTFTWGMAYTQHMRRVHNILAFTCEECGRNFESQKLLDDHKVRHTGVKKFVCDVCQKPYFSLTAVTVHKKYQHKQPEQSEVKHADTISYIPIEEIEIEHSII